jgi:hypothetical protein
MTNEEKIIKLVDSLTIYESIESNLSMLKFYNEVCDALNYYDQLNGSTSPEIHTLRVWKVNYDAWLLIFGHIDLIIQTKSIVPFRNDNLSEEYQSIWSV